MSETVTFKTDYLGFIDRSEAEKLCGESITVPVDNEFIVDTELVNNNEIGTYNLQHRYHCDYVARVFETFEKNSYVFTEFVDENGAWDNGERVKIDGATILGEYVDGFGVELNHFDGFIRETSEECVLLEILLPLHTWEEEYYNAVVDAAFINHTNPGAWNEALKRWNNIDTDYQ